MARNIYSRIHLRGMLVTMSPLHVGGYGEDVDTDLPLARDGAGQLYVPGTSLAGALRELAERLFGADMVNRLWGHQHGDCGHASLVVVEDAPIEHGNAVEVEIRDHVGIDREYGSSAEGIKYDRAILPRGTKLKLHLTIDVPEQGQRAAALAMLASLQQALETGEVRLGAAKTRGLGQVTLTDAQLTEQTFGSRQAILSLLRQPHGVVVSRDEITTAEKNHAPKKRPRLTLKVHWRPVGPLMVKASFDGIATDMVPLVSGCDGKVSLVLPGSSIKGALRSQAERIVRTVRGEIGPEWLGRNGKKKFLDAVNVTLVNELFGRQAEKVEVEDNCDWLPGLGALAVVDCFARKQLTVEQWRMVESAAHDQALRQALDKAGLRPWSQAYHVAIDRWLGSAAEAMLYTVLEPHQTEWEPLTLVVNLQRLPSNLQLPAVALLLLVVRDLANDRLPLGFATHRGMGTVKVSNVEIQGNDLESDLAELVKIQFHNGSFAHLPISLKAAWSRWC